jgi:hypothetical protein
MTIDESARSNAIGLVLGAPGRAGGASGKPARDPSQPSLLAVWGGTTAKTHARTRSKPECAEPDVGAGIDSGSDKKRRLLAPESGSADSAVQIEKPHVDVATGPANSTGSAGAAGASETSEPRAPNVGVGADSEHQQPTGSSCSSS